MVVKLCDWITARDGLQERPRGSREIATKKRYVSHTHDS